MATVGSVQRPVNHEERKIVERTIPVSDALARQATAKFNFQFMRI